MGTRILFDRTAESLSRQIPFLANMPRPLLARLEGTNRIYLPKAVVDHMQLEPGAFVAFTLRPDGKVVLSVPKIQA